MKQKLPLETEQFGDINDKNIQVELPIAYVNTPVFNRGDTKFRSDCSLGRSMVRFHRVCCHDKNKL